MPTAVARREERLLALGEEMAEKHEAIVHSLALDITSQGAPQTLFEEAIRLFGKGHVLINNAGMSPYQEFHERKRSSEVERWGYKMSERIETGW